MKALGARPMRLYMITRRGVEVIDHKGRTRKILRPVGSLRDIRNLMESRGYMLVIPTEKWSYSNA